LDAAQMESTPAATVMPQLFVRAGLQNAKRHLFLCIGPECCDPLEGEQAWENLKRRVKEMGAGVMRTKAACLRVCQGGPWLVIYPEGVWYGEVTASRLEVILERHVIGGQPVEDWVAVRTPCGGQSCAV
jgi:(2Fe-2S) ferredoxin